MALIAVLLSGKKKDRIATVYSLYETWKKTKKGVSYRPGRHAGTWFLHFIIDHILTNSRIQLCFKSVKNFTLNMEIDLTVMMEIDEMFSGIKSCNLRLSVLKNYFI